MENSMFWHLIYIKWTKQFSLKWELSVISPLSEVNDYTSLMNSYMNCNWRIFALTSGIICPEFIIIKVNTDSQTLTKRKRISQLPKAPIKWGKKSPYSKWETTQKIIVGKLSRQEQNLWLLVKVKVAQSCPTLCYPMDYTVHGILQAWTLGWVAFPFSRGSPQPRDRTHVSYIAGRLFSSWATREAQEQWSGYPISSPTDLPDPGIEPGVSCIAGRFFTNRAIREALPSA